LIKNTLDSELFNTISEDIESKIIVTKEPRFYLFIF
jgi:hypothetical protein